MYLESRLHAFWPVGVPLGGLGRICCGWAVRLKLVMLHKRVFMPAICFEKGVGIKHRVED
jgi:hypothetical protein